MDDALRIAADMNARVWDALKNSLEDVSQDEVHWRQLPQANTISLIVRHLRIESEWHLNSLDRGEPMPTIAVSPSQDQIDAIPNDFTANLKKLEVCYTRFLEILQTMTLTTLRERTASAYGAFAGEGRTYLIAYHQAIHAAMHCGQIRMIRNLYHKAHGQPARFFPENPTFPM